jgi:hypothetical protein
MKISFKNKGTSFSFPLPVWLVNLFPSGPVNAILRHHSEENEERILNNIDFCDIKKSLKLLKNYKGLKILELKNKNGDELTLKI